VAHLYECLFTDSALSQKLRTLSKMKEYKSTEWTPPNENGEETRKQESVIDLGALGSPRTYVEQVSEFSKLRI
jgi:hypothetical protein